MPNKLRNSKKDLINIKNNDNKFFLWCHIRHLNPLNTYPEIIPKADKSMVNDFDYEGIKFPVSKRDYSKIEQKNNICISVFCYENNLVYPVYVSDQKFKDYMDLLLITDKNKLHYVYIKRFNRFICNKTKCRIKKQFCRYYLQYLSSEKTLIKHKETCLKINGKQSVTLRSGTQLLVSFKIYADFECNVEEVKSNDRDKISSYAEKYQDHIP